MNVNFKKKIMWLNGIPAKDINSKGDAWFNETVCQMLYGAEQGCTQEEKYRAYRIMQRIERDPEHVELSHEDAVLVKRITGEKLTAGAYGQLVDMLEGKGGEA